MPRSRPRSRSPAPSSSRSVSPRTAAAGRTIAARLPALFRSARRRGIVPSVRDPGGQGLARDPITLGRIPASRAFRLGGVPYDAHSLADFLEASRVPHETYGRRSPRHPHNPGRRLSPRSAAGIRALATETGWRPRRS